MQEDSADTLHLIASFLLFDGRRNEATFEMMNEEGAFPRLLELIRGRIDDEAGLYRMLLELLYEMSRIQRLRIEDLSRSITRSSERLTTNEPLSVLIEDDFITYLFQTIEELSDDVNDPYHYPVIRVLVRLSDILCLGRRPYLQDSWYSMNNIWSQHMIPDLENTHPFP